MITTQLNKQADKQTNRQTSKKQTTKTDYATRAKTMKTLKCLPKTLFNIDIVDLCLLLCFSILLKLLLESFTKVFMSKVVLANLKISEPMYGCIVNI